MTHGMGLPGRQSISNTSPFAGGIGGSKRIEHSIDEPPVAMYVNHSYEPGLDLKEIPGEWRGVEDAWPVSVLFRSRMLSARKKAVE